jgi:hypothetical protein
MRGRRLSPRKLLKLSGSFRATRDYFNGSHAEALRVSVIPGSYRAVQKPGTRPRQPKTARFREWPQSHPQPSNAASASRLALSRFRVATASSLPSF